MKIITSKPIIFSGNPINNFSNLDGKSSSSDIMDFQKYAVSKGADLSYISATTKKLVSGNAVIDGIWGKKTADAYAKYGADWEKSKNITPGFRFDLQPKPSSQPTATNTTNQENGKGESSTSDSKNTNTNTTGSKQTPNYLTWALYGLGLIAIGVIAYKIVKSNKEE